jgi:hypothetical protein
MARMSHILGSVFVLSAAALTFGCSSSSTAATDDDAGKPTTDAGSTLYSRLGGHAGIRSAVDAIVAKELANDDIASYFYFQAGAPKNGHPTADQIEECFTDFVASAAGGTEKYPETIKTDAGSFTCRDMSTIHQPLMISGGTFDTFVMIAGTELAALKVSSADIATLAGALESTKSDIVDSKFNDAGLQTHPGDGG